MSAKGKYAKLIMVTAANNNKYYEMKEVNGQIQVTYGRVESTAINKTYSMYEWDKLYNSKVKKGYKDMTEFVSTEPDIVVKNDIPKGDGLSVIACKVTKDFMTRMFRYTNNLVSKTYSVKADKVSEAQVKAAQKMIDDLVTMDPTKKGAKEKINDKLLALYMVIPRYMSHTTNHLLPNIDFQKAMLQEQDNLDAMSAQVNMIKKEKVKAAKQAKKETKKSTKKVEEKSLLDVLGVKMKEGKVTKEIKYLVDQVKGTRTKVAGILTVEKNAEDTIFDEWMKKQKDKSTRYLIHGTRCTSVIPIIEQGLKVRPAGNFQFSGKAYGNGNYFSEVVQKSLGYTGYDSDKVLLVYEVHTGNPYVYQGWYRGNNFDLSYKELSKRGYDSTHVAAGNGLLNSEIIAYKEEQCRLKHIIWLN